MGSKTFAARLLALEALEAATSAPPERTLMVYLYIRPDDWQTLVGDDIDAALAVAHTYGLDRIGGNERVECFYFTRPGLHQSPAQATILFDLDADGYGLHVMQRGVSVGSPAPGEWHWYQ
jgi:hypothetical protein